MLPTITLEGRAVADPELRFTPSGAAVANFRVAASESKKTDTGWEDGDKLFVNVAVWKEAGEAVAEHVRKGDKVIVTGRLYQREYETSSGEKRNSLEVKFATVAKVVDPPKASRQQTQQAPAAAANDPWATPASGDEPPF
jgi:single-strand DNA-binding protein